MTYQHKNRGVCSISTTVTLNDDATIAEVSVLGGCNGNLKGIMSLLKGMNAEDAIARLEGIRCGSRPTSCPDQIAHALREALAQMG
ncbi:MAG TPA: TIGR03905 family TSCPD domain-containing protein [Candidatus Anaerofilum faecale]|nr:TIGR03905 family TSCPD domain-containing protein [Candidatus Anaerofilum faecale]